MLHNFRTSFPRNTSEWLLLFFLFTKFVISAFYLAVIFLFHEYQVFAFIFLNNITAWKVSKYGSYFWSHFPVFGLNTGRYGLEITLYLDTFHAVYVLKTAWHLKIYVKQMFTLEYMGRWKWFLVIFGILIFETLEWILQKMLLWTENSNLHANFCSRKTFHNWYFDLSYVSIEHFSERKCQVWRPAMSE